MEAVNNMNILCLWKLFFPKLKQEGQCNNPWFPGLCMGPAGTQAHTDLHGLKMKDEGRSSLRGDEFPVQWLGRGHCWPQRPPRWQKRPDLYLQWALSPRGGASMGQTTGVYKGVHGEKPCDEEGGIIYMKYHTRYKTPVTQCRTTTK